MKHKIGEKHGVRRNRSDHNTKRIHGHVLQDEHDWFLGMKRRAERRVGSEMTHGDFLVMLMSVYEFHLEEPERTDGAPDLSAADRLLMEAAGEGRVRADGGQDAD